MVTRFSRANPRRNKIVYAMADCEVSEAIGADPSPKDDMEEGEISEDGEELSAPVQPRPRNSDFNLEVTINNRNLPVSITNSVHPNKSWNFIRSQDLLKEIGASGVDVLDRQVTERLEARAKRFNLQQSGINANVSFDDVVKLYQR